MGYGITGRGPEGSQGFSLIELILVMVIISMTFLFFIPRFPSFSGEDRTFTLQLAALAKKLKQRAGEGTPSFLNIDPDAGKIWVTSGSPETPEEASSPEITLALPENMRVLDVAFRVPGVEKEGPVVRIGFYKKGYSDWAAIHFEKEDGERFSMVIEPFLSEVSLVDGYDEFDGR